MKLTHPSGIIVITTFDMLRQHKEIIQTEIKRNEAELQLIDKEILGVANAQVI